MQVAQRAEKGNEALIRLKCMSFFFVDKGLRIPFRHLTVYCHIRLDVAWHDSPASSDVDLIDRTGKR
jgi:hypothetical protein